MFVSAKRAAGRAFSFVPVALALGWFLAVAAAPAAHAQRAATASHPPRETVYRNPIAPLRSPDGKSYGLAPLRHGGGMGNTTFLPADITRRSLTAPRYHGRNAKTRVQIGTTAPVNVNEKVVNLTVKYTVPDMRTPFWSQDETRIYYSSNQDPAGTNAAVPNGRPYHLYYISGGIPANLAAVATPTALNAATDTSDYLYPAINANSNSITFIRSSDGKALTDPTKTWVLCYAPLPTAGTTIDPAAIVIAGGPNITFPNATGQTSVFTNIGRPTWLGNNNIIFSGILQGDKAYHIFQANLQPTAGQSIIFQLTAGSADERNPAVAADGKILAFDSNATPIIGTTGTEGYGVAGLPRQVAYPQNVPTTSTGVGTTKTSGAINRNIFTMNLIAIADPTQTTTGGVLPAYTVRQFTERGANAIDVDNEEPAWSSLNNNQYSNPGGTTQQREYLAYSSTRNASFDTNDPTGTTITGYTAGTLHHIYYELATTDAGNTVVPESAIGTANGAIYLDTGDSATAPQFDDRYPTWSPFVSAFRIAFQSDRTGDYLADNFEGYSTGGFKMTPGRNNLFVATVIDTTAPTLLRWDLNSTTGEVVHINLVKNQNEPFDPSTSVRNSDDGVVPGSTIHLAVRVEDRESGMRPDKAVFIQVKNPNSKYQSLFQGSTNPAEHKEYTDDPWTLFINNAYIYYTAINTAQTGPRILNFGREYEAEALGITNNISTVGTVLVNTGTMGTTYYGHEEGLGQAAGSSALAANDVLYGAGIDDQAAFSGNALVPLDGTGTTNNGTTPSVWLELKPLYKFDPNSGNPVLDSSGNQKPYLPTDLGTNQPAGGVLYGASLKLPDEPSDWYLDVILYDNAVNPFETDEKYNAIIYDNVWGFSSAPPITPRPADILVVSDYALGQKFFNSRFAELGNFNTGDNLLPIDFGSESYFTDVDVNKFFENKMQGGGGYVYSGFSPFGEFENRGIAKGVPNVLGVKAFVDAGLISSSQNIDGAFLPDLDRYDIWRILSRGPVPTNVLNAYLPSLTTRNPDIYPNPTTKKPYETAAQPVVDAQRMVVWNAPFSGDLFTGQGTIVDTQTQNNLQNFVSQGGRLFLSGQDVAFALTSNGTNTNPFLTNVAQVKFISDTSVVQSITPAATAGNYADRIQRQPWRRALHSYWIKTSAGTDVTNYPNTTIPLSSNIATTGGDAAGTVGTANGGIQSDDTVAVAPTTANSSVAVFNHGSAQGITVSTYGSGVMVFSSVGFETVSQDWYTISNNGTEIDTPGRRSELMHNITCSLRSGTIIGQIIDTSGNPVTGALVRATTGPENEEASGTGITDSGGKYIIRGLQPDAYAIYAYKNGFYSQHNTAGAMHGTGTVQLSLALKPANPGSLSGFAVAAAASGNRGGVFETDGKTPIQGIAIQVRQQDLANGLYDIVAASTTSGVDGSYSLPSIPIGNYIIVANPKDQNTNYNPNVATVQVTAAPNAGFKLSTGETVNADDTVTINENTSFFVNFFLAASPQKVSGLVESSAAGNPGIPGAVVSATLVGSTTIFATAITDANGNYTLSLVSPTSGSDATEIPAGTYTINASKSGFGTGTATIIVGGGAKSATLVVPPIILTVLPAGSVEGLVQVSSGQQFSSASAAGAIVSLYPIITVNGVQQPDMSQAPLTGTVSATVTTTPVTGYDNETGVTGTGTAKFNFVIPNVPGGSANAGTQYIAILTPQASTGLTPSPAQALVTVFSATATYDVNFLLQPPHTYAAGLDLISLPGDYSSVADTAGIFGITPLGDNNGNGVSGEPTDTAIYNTFDVAEWTGTSYVIDSKIKPQAGKGYFVRFGAPAGIVQKGNPVTSASFTISLTNNWNLIGNPFNDRNSPTTAAGNIDITDGSLVTFTYTTANGAVRTNVPESTAVADGAVQKNAYYYTGSSNGSQYVATGILQGYNGYWFRAYVPVQMTLSYPGSSATGKAAKLPVAVDHQYRTITRAEMDAMTPLRSLNSTSLTSWEQRISVSQGSLLDTDNTIGVAVDAASGWDNRYDAEKPPLVDGAPSIRLTIDGVDASGRKVALSDRMQPASAATKTWNLTVNPAEGVNDPVTISWPNSDRLPRGVTPVLIDVASGKRITMRSGASSYTYRPNGKSAQVFRIEVAPPASKPLDIVNFRTIHTRAAGANYFRFNFLTTRDAEVRTNILSLSGRLIRSLTTRAETDSETSVGWDGRNNLGAVSPAGPYVVEIRAVDSTGASVERKVMFMNLN